MPITVDPKTTEDLAHTSYRRTVEAEVHGAVTGRVEIEEYEDGQKRITLTGAEIDSGFSSDRSVGWQFDDLDACEAFARACIDAVAKARVVGIGVALPVLTLA